MSVKFPVRCKFAVRGTLLLVGILSCLLYLISLAIPIFDPSRHWEYEDNSSCPNSLPIRHRWYMKNPDTFKILTDERCELWPKTLVNNDRIENQLLFQPKQSIRSKKSIFLHEAVDNPPDGDKRFRGCPVSHCTTTTNPEMAGKTDAILFRNEVKSTFVNVSCK